MFWVDSKCVSKKIFSGYGLAYILNKTWCWCQHDIKTWPSPNLMTYITLFREKRTTHQFLNDRLSMKKIAWQGSNFMRVELNMQGPRSFFNCPLVPIFFINSIHGHGWYRISLGHELQKNTNGVNVVNQVTDFKTEVANHGGLADAKPRGPAFEKGRAPGLALLIVPHI